MSVPDLVIRNRHYHSVQLVPFSELGVIVSQQIPMYHSLLQHSLSSPRPSMISSLTDCKLVTDNFLAEVGMGMGRVPRFDSHLQGMFLSLPSPGGSAPRETFLDQPMGAQLKAGAPVRRCQCTSVLNPSSRCLAEKLTALLSQGFIHERKLGQSDSFKHWKMTEMLVKDGLLYSSFTSRRNNA